MSRSTTLIRSLALVGVLGVAGTGLVACGSSSTSASDTGSSTPTATVSSGTTASTAGTTDTASTTGTTAAAASTVAVTLGSPQAFSLVPSPTSAPAGKITFNVDNVGSMAHEMVILKTDTKAADLPTTKNGEAVETGNVGETGDMAAGTKKTITVTLQKGHYVLLCNLPGHYAGGMYKDFTVS